MRQPNQNNPADMLELIQKVDAPPFLPTRIRQKIDAARDQRIAPAMAWAGCLSLVLIMTVNIYLIAGTSNAPRHSAPQTNLAQSMNLYPNNSLY